MFLQLDPVIVCLHALICSIVCQRFSDFYDERFLEQWFKDLFRDQRAKDFLMDLLRNWMYQLVQTVVL